MSLVLSLLHFIKSKFDKKIIPSNRHSNTQSISDFFLNQKKTSRILVLEVFSFCMLLSNYSAAAAAAASSSCSSNSCKEV